MSWSVYTTGMSLICGFGTIMALSMIYFYNRIDSRANQRGITDGPGPLEPRELNVDGTVDGSGGCWLCGGDEPFINREMCGKCLECGYETNIYHVAENFKRMARAGMITTRELNHTYYSSQQTGELRNSW